MSSLSRTLITASLLTASLSFAGWTQEGAASVTFDAKGPAGFKIHGVSEKATVKDDGTTFAVTVKLEDIDTDNSLRNRHMLEDVGAKDFPVMTLTVPTTALKESGANLEADGTLEMHGQKKAVKFTYTPRCSGGACDIDATGNFSLSDFGIKIRSYLGITVKPEIVMGAKFKVKK
jgi:polyisoprenoid-binding protein YceI